MSLSTNEAMQTPILSYLYQEFNDDEDLQAFVDTYNQMAQGYLDWFNTTPLGLYTNSNISGDLLDWTLDGIYGITRPTISTGTNVTEGPVGTYAVGTLAVGEYYSATVTSVEASDDIYKRYATWILYQGDGVQMTVQWLLRRINRFIYGTYGADASLDTLQNITLTITSGVDSVTITDGGSGYSTAPTVTFSAPTSGVTATGTATISSGAVTSVTITAQGSGYTEPPTVTFSVPGSGTTATGIAVMGTAAAAITVPSVSGATEFQSLVSNNLLPLPLQMTFSVTVG